MRRPPLAVLLIAAAAIWLPSLHLFYDADRTRIADGLATRRTRETEPMRRVNPEWDFMARTYTVLALANRALVRPDERPRDLAAIDAVIDETLGDDDHFGAEFFLLPYARERRFLDPETHSLFVDGEIIMMIAARELVAPREGMLPIARKRAERVRRTMERSPSLSAESYPDDCWTFCNTTALAALAMLDRVDGTDHAPLARAWVAYAREHLVDRDTGILVSRYGYDGRVFEGPEGSTIWMSAHNLLVVDEDFARDQYARARRELGASFLGFGWAREWPRSAPERPDVDSGPIVPFLGASAGSSGLALLGASAFGDDAWLSQLLASLELAAYPDGAKFQASNDVGDAVLFYALSYGPLFARVRETRTVQR
ncbi:MAG TPA: hypothetical protein VIF62_14975 [Labilithrix sp.]